MAEIDQHVELLRRQFFQLMNPDELTLPPRAVLRRPDIQAQIYDSIFRTDRVIFPASNRYRSRVLKLLVGKVEQSIEDPDEDEISDDLTLCLAETLAQPSVLDADLAQRKTYVTYSAPTPLSVQTFAITTLESPALLAAAGTTGLRTWEAAKFLASFLWTAEGRVHVHGKRVIELGAGTGLVSMFCARHLGAKFTLATDGTGEVVDSVVENMFLNQLDDRKAMDAVVLKWGHAIMPELVMDEDGTRHYDLVIGADIIFDDRLILPLVSSIQELFEMYANMKGLIATTIRNQETVDKFLGTCLSRNIVVTIIASSLHNADRTQTGLFYSPEPEIKIFELTRTAPE